MVWLPSIRISGSTIGANPASWLNAAKSASARAFTSMHVRVGRCSPIAITARHLVNRAPNSRYSMSRSRRPSSPSVIFSPAKAARGVVCLSTLMPGMTPCFASTSAMGLPSVVCWRIVSSNRIAPLMHSPSPGVVKSISRYARRFSSVETMFRALNRSSIVGILSSAARMPLPDAMSAATVDCISLVMSAFTPVWGIHFASRLRMARSSFRRFASDLGYAIRRSLSASRTIWDTINRAFSLSSAGTTYQGA